jgi:lysophospholipase L1-like esterase
MKLKKHKAIAIHGAFTIVSAVFLLLFIILRNEICAAEPLSLWNGDTVAICGDSITEQKLYSVFIEDYLIMCQPVAGLRAHQFGWAGEKADGLLGRIKSEVAPFQPAVATTCYGMNDGNYSAIDPAREAAYRTNTEEIIKAFKEAGVRFIVIGSPGVVDSDMFDRAAYNNHRITALDYNTKTLASLGDIARQVATEQGVVFADVHGPMMSVMAKAKEKYGSNYAVAGVDGIHPSANGHLIMAYAFLKALGCDGDIGTITVDLAQHQASATAGHRVVAFTNGEVQMESTRYPFCFYDNSEDSTSTRGVLEFLPFNAELNQFRLVVHEATAPELKITWGSTSKIFSAAELEMGINLAAEFLDNPFSAQFKSVEDAIKQQQQFETPAVKEILHSLTGWVQLLPEEREAFNQISRSALKKANDLCAAASAAITPVKHTLKIEAVSK